MLQPELLGVTRTYEVGFYSDIDDKSSSTIGFRFHGEIYL